MIDWRSILATGMRGIVVEGQDDRIVIEAFLDAGEKEGRWANWRQKLAIEAAGGRSAVLKELDEVTDTFKLWALLDREWHPANVVSELQTKYANLYFLPRRMIENYAINPDELLALLPSNQIKRIGKTHLKQTIESELVNWLLHGALYEVLYEHGAGEYRTRYPFRLLNPPHAPVINEAEIESWLHTWHDQLDPDQIMPAYRQRVIDFRNRPISEQYRYCVHGKFFFDEVVVNQLLNRTSNKQKSGEWLEELFRATVPHQCASDLIPLLTNLIEAV